MEVEGSEKVCQQRWGDGGKEEGGGGGGGCRIILRFSWRFLMMQHRKIILMLIFPLLTNKCGKITVYNCLNKI